MITPIKATMNCSTYLVRRAHTSRHKKTQTPYATSTRKKENHQMWICWKESLYNGNTFVSVYLYIYPHILRPWSMLLDTVSRWCFIGMKWMNILNTSGSNSNSNKRATTLSPLYSYGFHSRLSLCLSFLLSSSVWHVIPRIFEFWSPYQRHFK